MSVRTEPLTKDSWALQGPRGPLIARHPRLIELPFADISVWHQSTTIGTNQRPHCNVRFPQCLHLKAFSRFPETWRGLLYAHTTSVRSMADPAILR